MKSVCRNFSTIAENNGDSARALNQTNRFWDVWDKKQYLSSIPNHSLKENWNIKSAVLDKKDMNNLIVIR